MAAAGQASGDYKNVVTRFKEYENVFLLPRGGHDDSALRDSANRFKVMYG
jgi:hypothetical protein